MRCIALKFSALVLNSILVVVGNLSVFCRKNRVIRISSDLISRPVLGCIIGGGYLDKVLNLPVEVLHLSIFNFTHDKSY